MQSKIIFFIIFMLSFSVFHDAVLPLLDKNGHNHIVHTVGDKLSSSDCNNFNDVHNMLHFVAIVDDYNNKQIEFARKKFIQHRLIHYSPPPAKTAYKPPIV